VQEAVFTGRELDIMSVLWRSGSGSVAEVRQALGDSVAYTTVLKLLQILEGKGAVRHEAEGRAYRYYPLVEPGEAGRNALSKILEKIFGKTLDSHDRGKSAERPLAAKEEGRPAPEGQAEYTLWMRVRIAGTLFSQREDRHPSARSGHGILDGPDFAPLGVHGLAGWQEVRLALAR